VKFAQRRGRVRAEFEFAPDALVHSYAIRGNRRGGTTPYEQIPLAWKYAKARAWKLKYFSAAGGLAGLVAGAYALEAIPAPGQAWLTALVALAICNLVGILSFFADPFARSRAGMTIIPVKNEIRILDDGRCPAILDEIRKRRLAAMRLKLGAVDPFAAPGAESRKFRWLREEGAITEEEYAAAMAQLGAARDAFGAVAVDRTKLN